MIARDHNWLSSVRSSGKHGFDLPSPYICLLSNSAVGGAIVLKAQFCNDRRSLQSAAGGLGAKKLVKICSM